MQRRKKKAGRGIGTIQCSDEGVRILGRMASAGLTAWSNLDQDLKEVTERTRIPGGQTCLLYTSDAADECVNV